MIVIFQVFSTCDELLIWVRNVGKPHKSMVVIFKTDKGQTTRKIYVVLTCEISGAYKAIGLNPTSSRKCYFAFILKGRMVKALGGWVLKVICGTHNHTLVRDLKGHRYVGRLTKEEKAIVNDRTKKLIKPKVVMHSIQSKNPDRH